MGEDSGKDVDLLPPLEVHGVPVAEDVVGLAVVGHEHGGFGKRA